MNFKKEFNINNKTDLILTYADINSSYPYVMSISLVPI